MTSDRFSLLLDACINAIHEGVSVEECLRAHPEEAAELETHLRVFSRAAAQSATAFPSSEAKERGRQRLQAELLALSSGRPQRMRRMEPPSQLS